MAHDVYQYVNPEIEAHFTARVGKSDNGLTGVHYAEYPEIEDVRFETVWMFGRDWTGAEMVEKFGKQGADALIGLLEDQLLDDMIEWERA